MIFHLSLQKIYFIWQLWVGCMYVITISSHKLILSSLQHGCWTCQGLWPHATLPHCWWFVLPLLLNETMNISTFKTQLFNNLKPLAVNISIFTIPWHCMWSHHCWRRDFFLACFPSPGLRRLDQMEAGWCVQTSETDESWMDLKKNRTIKCRKKTFSVINKINYSND